MTDNPSEKSEPEEDGVADFVELLEEAVDGSEQVIDRHTRHFYDAKTHHLSDEEWEEFRTESRERFGVDADELAERGKEHYTELGIKPLGED